MKPVILITGGSRGIGAATALLAAAKGYAVAVNYASNSQAADKIVSQIRAQGGTAIAIQADVADEAQVQTMFKKVDAELGPLSALVNNAGINDGVGLASGNYEKFMASLHANLIHYYLMAQACLPHLIKSKGAIVNIGSKTAETGQGNTSAYAASNGGRNALTREWAVELLPYEIRVNSVIVAECYTPMYDKWIKTLENPGEKLKSITQLLLCGVAHRYTKNRSESFPPQE